MKEEMIDVRKKGNYRFITLYLTNEEFIWLTDESAAALTSKCGYIRKRIFTGRFPRAKVNLDDAEKYRTLRELLLYLKLLPDKIEDPSSLAVLEEKLGRINEYCRQMIKSLVK